MMEILMIAIFDSCINQPRVASSFTNLYPAPSDSCCMKMSLQIYLTVASIHLFSSCDHWGIAKYIFRIGNITSTIYQMFALTL